MILLTCRLVAVWVRRTVKFSLFLLENIYFSGCDATSASLLVQELFLQPLGYFAVNIWEQDSIL